MTRSRTIAMALAALAIFTGIIIAVIPNGSSHAHGQMGESVGDLG